MHPFYVQHVLAWTNSQDHKGPEVLQGRWLLVLSGEMEVVLKCGAMYKVIRVKAGELFCFPEDSGNYITHEVRTCCTDCALDSAVKTPSYSVLGLYCVVLQ